MIAALIVIAAALYTALTMIAEADRLAPRAHAPGMPAPPPGVAIAGVVAADAVAVEVEAPSEPAVADVGAPADTGVAVLQPDPDRLIQHEIDLPEQAGARALALLRLVAAIAFFGVLVAAIIIGTAKALVLLVEKLAG